MSWMWATMGGIVVALAVAACAVSPPPTSSAELEPATAHSSAVRSYGTIVGIDPVAGTATEAYDINEAGDVVGVDYDVWRGAGAVRAFRYTAGGTTTAVVVDAQRTAGYGINAAGTIAGQSDVSAFTQTAAGGSELHATPAAGSDINDAGQVTGFYYPPGDSAKAFRAGSGVAIEVLPALPGAEFNGVVHGRAIDNAGRVVGLAYTTEVPQSFDNARAFISSGVGQIQDLNELVAPGLGWKLSAAHDVSGAYVVGYGFKGGEIRGFRYRDGGAIDEIGTLPAYPWKSRSMAEGVNRHGVVVGHVFSNEGGDSRAWVFTNQGELHDLNEYVDPALGWTLEVATAINDRNQVVGWGTLGGAARAFKLQLPELDPCPPADQCSEVGVRDLETGECSYEPLAAGTSCNDGNRCTADDVCRAGVCQPGPATACTGEIFYPPLTDLGVVGGTASEAYDINDAGEVVGLDYATSQGGGRAVGFRYTPATGAVAIRPDPQLGQGGTSAHVWGINNTGTVSGAIPFGGSAFTRNVEGVTTIFPGPSVAWDVNDAGQAVGYYYPPEPGYGGHIAYLRLPSGEMKRLAAGTPFEFTRSDARAIDASGRVVGVHGFWPVAPQFEAVWGMSFRPFEYSATTGTRDLNDLVDPSLGWTLVGAWDVEGPFIVGHGIRGNEIRGYRYRDGGTVDEIGTLPQFPGKGRSWAEGVNARGDVVGHVFSHGGGDNRAWVFTRDNQLYDLNAFVDPASGWTLQVATAINDRNQVVGWGTRNGLKRAFKLDLPDLSPCPAAPDQCHQNGARDLATGHCGYDPLADGTTCDDGNSCTQTDSCQAGACVGVGTGTCAVAVRFEGTAVFAPGDRVAVFSYTNATAQALQIPHGLENYVSVDDAVVANPSVLPPEWFELGDQEGKLAMPWPEGATTVSWTVGASTATSDARTLEVIPTEQGQAVQLSGGPVILRAIEPLALTSRVGKVQLISDSRGWENLKEFAERASKVMGTFSGIVGGIETAIKVLKFLGILSQPDEFAELEALINSVGVGLSWQIAGAARDTEIGTVKGTLLTINTTQELGLPYTFGPDGSAPPGYQDSVNKVTIAQEPGHFERLFVHPANDGVPSEGIWLPVVDVPKPIVPLDTRLLFARSITWKDVITNWESLIEKDFREQVYDWRLGVPELMQLIAMRLHVIATVNPNFRSDASFDAELLGQRESLKRELTNMLSGVVCNSRTRFHQQLLAPVVAFGCDVACADINTGLSAMRRYLPTITRTRSVSVGQFSYDVDNVTCEELAPIGVVQSATQELLFEVTSRMPLFYMRSMIDMLWIYANGLEDLARIASPISPTLRPDLCLDASIPQLDFPQPVNPLQVWHPDLIRLPRLPGAPMPQKGIMAHVNLRPCNGTAQQQWVYNRTTGQIFNPGRNRCLEAEWGNSGWGTRIWSKGCTIPVDEHAHDDYPPQLWSYDAERQILWSALSSPITVLSGNLTSGATTIQALPLFNPNPQNVHTWR